MKQCTKCQAIKNENEFYKNRGYIDSRCRTCIQQYNSSRKEINNQNLRNWRKRNIERDRKRARVYRQKLFEENQKLINELKSKPCSDCYESFPPIAMDFDHRPEEIKKFEISQTVRIRRFELILKEIQKCDLVCSNCHRTRTKNRRIFKIKTNKYAKRYEFLKNWVESLKNKACDICNKNYKPWQMDFDHIDPKTKTKSICDLVRMRTTQIKILEEIQKCRLLCSNCHRIHTANQLKRQCPLNSAT